MTKVRKDEIENEKSQISIEIFVCKFINFLRKFQSALGFSQKRKDLPLSFLNSFRIIKDLQ